MMRGITKRRTPVYFPLVTPFLLVFAAAFALSTIELMPVDVEYPDTIATQEVSR